MKYKLFGKSGLRVSELCLGAMTFGDGESWLSGREESFRILSAYAEAGGNYIDTANIYAHGQSEQIVGEFISSDREQFVIATKYTHAFPGTAPVNGAGNHRKSMVSALDSSLKRLNTDYIDIYWLHLWDFLTPVDEVMRALNDAVAAGKIHYIGFSDVPAWIVVQANMVAERHGWNPITGLQLEYSLVQRSIERELIPMARAFDISVNAWSPLSSGVLSGKYTRGKEADFRRGSAGFDIHTLNDEKRLIAEAVDEIADEIGISSAAVALSWVLCKGTIPILGARTSEQLADNLTCLDCKLTEKQIAKLDEISAIDFGHPYDMLDNPGVIAVTYGGFREQIDFPAG
ncbi:MAG: aldo/keto reductase [Halieaceae bacterium]|nr:aldo/keto reductase [Halieaceae bacterium]